MMRSKFYVCPVCGNSIHSMGEAVIQCHGIILTPCQAEESDENHMIFVERVEDEYYVRMVLCQDLVQDKMRGSAS